MKKHLPLIAAATLILCFSIPTYAQKQNRPPEGFTALFNGENLDGWFGLGHFSPIELGKMSDEDRAKKKADGFADAKKHWTVENGELVNDGKGAYLTTEKEFTDYELWIDYKTVAKADSGIYLKGNPQVQIWDFTEAGGKWNIGADKGSGGLWNNSKGAKGKDPMHLADKPFGEWNRFRIIQVGATTSVWLNDKLIVDHAIMENFWDRKSPLFRSGFIQLQTHGGEIRWRNIFIKEYTADESNAYLSEGSKDFAKVFNGENFEGWEGATKDYQIKEGALMCKPGKGGNLFTSKEYSNFVARLEFNLPPGGNNGLAIRYPGKGNPAYDGMTELQVLDSEHPKYARLDKRQYHASAYGMAAATRGYLRKSGEWNFQEVHVDGSKITVILNGNKILDTDLSKITEYMANSKHPGKELEKGHFGFAGHNDPVQFRNIHIKEIE